MSTQRTGHPRPRQQISLQRNQASCRTGRGSRLGELSHSCRPSPSGLCHHGLELFRADRRSGRAFWLGKRLRRLALQQSRQVSTVPQIRLHRLADVRWLRQRGPLPAGEASLHPDEQKIIGKIAERVTENLGQALGVGDLDPERRRELHDLRHRHRHCPVGCWRDRVFLR